MSSPKRDSGQSAVDKLKARLPKLRKKYFTPPGRAAKPVQGTLANAIRKAFPNSDASYLRLIERRFREAYRVPEAEAIIAVQKGYSSPGAAMRARVIKRRDYLGFEGERDE